MENVFTEDKTLIAYASEASAFGALVNWQEASRSEVTVPVRHPGAQALPVFNPATAQTKAVAGAPLTDAAYIARQTLALDKLRITCQDYALHALVSVTDYEDAKNNPDTSVDIDEIVRRDSAARVARTIDDIVKAALSGAAEIEYAAANKFGVAWEAALADLEGKNIDGRMAVMPRRAKAIVRAAKDTTGRQMYDLANGEFDGVPVVWVDNDAFAADELCYLTNPLYIHGAVMERRAPKVLDQTYRYAGQIGFETYIRMGAKVLLHKGTDVPAVKIVDKVQ